MKAMNFYTANGWAGLNYDSKLSTKEIAAKVRSYAKKNFPEFKFSVRSEWSMYTDSMYIELKSGPCVPFVEGSRSAERGYMSTMSTVKGWENELTPEMFKVLDAVTTYASSFRYNDSDGMQDYFDTNFYIHIEVSDEYQVIEPKAKKSNVKVEKVEEAKEVKSATVEGIEVVDYSEKAIAVFGDTKAIKEQLKELGGRFNPSLNYNGEKRAGWIFSKKQADKVKELIAPTELPALPEEIYIPELAEHIDSNNLKDEKECTLRDFVIKYGFKELKGKKILSGGKIVYIHEKWFAPDKVNDFKDYKKQPYKFRLYGGNTPDADLVDWVYSSDLVIFSEETQENNTPLIIHLTETDDFNGVRYYHIEGAGIITSAKVRADIQPGDVFNVYTDKERKYGVTYDGVSVESSLKNDLPGIIEFNDKIESGTLSVSSYYTPMDENVEFYEKKVKGKRYITENKPKRGYYYVIDTLDNCPVGFFQTKGEAEKETEILNGFTDGNGRLKTVI